MPNEKFHQIAKSWLKSSSSSAEGMRQEYNYRGQESSYSLAQELPPNVQKKLPSFALKNAKNSTHATDQEQGFDATQFFINGWQGDSLASKHFFKAKKNFEECAFKIKLKLLKEKNYPLKIFQSLYHEYIYFQKMGVEDFDERDLLSETDFIHHVKNKLDDQEQSIGNFFSHYSQKILSLHWAKLRFIKKLLPANQWPINDKELLSPLSLLWKVFPVGSGKELKSKLFHADQYSWIRFDEDLLPHIVELYQLCSELSFAEMFKIITLNDPRAKSFSHSISSKSLGLMINSLVINLSNWLELSEQQVSSKKTASLGANLKNTFFYGDYLLELNLSHWLAQENNAHFKWEDIIIPFIQDKNPNLQSGHQSFYQKINESQFLSFMADISGHYTPNKHTFVREMIARSNQALYEQNETSAQTSLLQEFHEGAETYDYVVLSLIKTPKNNGHFHLINTILQMSQKLNPYGQILVLSSQNLFVPSQGERVHGLLKKLKLCCAINMESLQGRGEVPSFLYVFKKFPQEMFDADLERQSFSHFRLSGELKSFCQFAVFPEEISSFFKKNWHTPPTIYHKHLPNDLELNFHTEVVVKGQLISPGNSPQLSNIAHPSFFKNMTQNCLPLNYFYDVSSVEPEKLKHGIVSTLQQDKQISFDALAPDFSNYGQALLIDVRNNQEIKVEMIHPEALVSKAYEYGVSQCFYFLLRPKLKNLNPNIFKNYFDSTIGRQIIQLSFQGPFHQLKSKIVTLLIPKTFSEQERLPASMVMAIDDLMQSSVAQKHWKNYQTDLEVGLKSIQEMLPAIPQNALTTLVAMGSNLKVQTINLMSEWKNTKNFLDRIDFSSQEVQNKLSQCSPISMYPGHPEIEVDFLGDLQKALKMPLQSFQMDGGSQHKNKITLYSSMGPVVVINSTLELVALLSKILPHLKGRTIEQILLGLKVPKTQELTIKLGLERPDAEVEQKALNMIDDLLNSCFIRMIKYI
jgi:hypothetical protein